MSELFDNVVNRLELKLFEVKEALEDGDEHSALELIDELEDEAKVGAANIRFYKGMDINEQEDSI